MNLSTTAVRVFPGPRDEVFATCTDTALIVECFQDYGPIPGVTAVSLQEATELAEGVRRRITTSDGVSMTETVLAFERPSVHRYHWGGELEPPFAWLVAGATGDWVFTDVPQGTQVSWTYTFELTSWLAAPITWPLTWVFRQWMSRVLDALAASREG